MHLHHNHAVTGKLYARNLMRSYYNFKIQSNQISKAEMLELHPLFGDIGTKRGKWVDRRVTFSISHSSAFTLMMSNSTHINHVAIVSTFLCGLNQSVLRLLSASTFKLKCL